ncbi:uncharacterized protein TRIADDRAFT_23332 [Trichoplax adhaerens]|uniref:RNA helicase n=1 Tax=Trichoplax adhaerens TaxID=10228 RepID=B3RR31_TRIAD|nr:hypothetical protein TRIADDRAFT_23332 [Trichoplax adhaerens]EDV26272.1 hypothetical protein TRIADDRAFT_23332 [Trichoplax adhaerens]|eukprot:XP_002110268.1 hypothetical protein TRIADDRAFT_23332 [Trichoplax adhaerens]
MLEIQQEKQELKKEKIEEENSDSDKDNEEIVSFSKNQRWPQDDEPKCVMCGRYGAYICDQTDEDVCSLECKAKHLHDIQHKVRISLEERKKLKMVVEYSYQEHEQVANLQLNQVENLRQELDIKIEGNHSPNPIFEFEHVSLDPRIMKNLQANGYISMTPVQMQVIPAALSKRNLLVSSPTGSGKTGSFLIPLIHMTFFEKDDEQEQAPKVLILSPTRELCIQIEDQCKEIMTGRLPNMKTCLIVGGLPLPQQLYRLKQGIQFVIATPGRLIDIISKHEINFSKVKTVVIDEVDAMMQLGFEKQVEQIMQVIPRDHQTLMFSATVTVGVEKMTSVMLSNPIKISVGKPNSLNPSVKHLVLWVEEQSKKKMLFTIINDGKHFHPPTLIFVASKIGADFLADAINAKCRIRAASLHGDKPQQDRINTLKLFLEGKHPILVTTGVAGRGIDLECVKQVIHFDLPTNIHEYIHQVGRTGRLHSLGWAISLINNDSKDILLL